LSSQIDHIEVWDTFNNKATKLGNVFGKNVDEKFPVSGDGPHQMTVQDIGPAPTYEVLHKEVTSYTVTSKYGVTINTPAENSTQATLFPLNAFAVEAGAEESSSGIDHIEVWNGTTKLGDSPKGTAISQWFSLPPGKYTLSIQDVTDSGQRLHESKVSFTVVSSLGVFVNSPANNSTLSSTTIPINAYAYEQSGSRTPLVDHIEVWDMTHGIKLGQSPVGTGVNSVFINQTVTVPAAGEYQLSILDVNPNDGYKSIHTSVVNVKVK
jgi:hypothetical protein